MIHFVAYSVLHDLAKFASFLPMSRLYNTSHVDNKISLTISVVKSNQLVLSYNLSYKYSQTNVTVMETIKFNLFS